MPALINPRWEAYSRRRAAAVHTLESCAASVRAVNPRLAESTIDGTVNAWNKRPEVRARIAELQRSSERTAAAALARSLPDMQLAELVADLVGVWKTPVGDVDENHQFAQEVTIDPNGRKKIKMIPKLEAVQLMATLKGWKSEATVLVNLPGFAATVRDVSPVPARLQDQPAADQPQAPAPAVVDVELSPV